VSKTNDSTKKAKTKYKQSNNENNAWSEGRKCDLITSIMNNESVSKHLPEFGRNFHVVQQSNGIRTIVEELKDKVVKHVDESVVVDAILSYCRDKLALKKGYFEITHKLAKEAMKYWRSATTPLKEPIKSIAFESDDCFTYHRLDFDPIEDASLDDCPTWKEALLRMSNREAFCKRIGSFFDDKANRKQAIYLSGEKDSGKSQLIAVTASFCGSGNGNGEGIYTTLSNEDLKSAHYKASLVGKRVVVVNEANSRFINSEAFKSLTGDNLHNINPKGSKMFEARLLLLIIFVSNSPPQVSSDPAIKVRLIDCRIEPVPLPREELLPEAEYQKNVDR